MTVLGFVPDDKTVGDVTAALHFKNFPEDVGSDTVLPTLTGETDVRVTGRSVRVKITQVNPNWRWGTPRLDVAQGGRR